MNFLISMLPTAVVLGVLIVIHEYGHFLACRIFKVKVEKFSIGFGPQLFKWKRRETEFVLAALPLGGFVKPSGESLSELDGQEPQPGDYLAAPWHARFVIVSAGVVMNYLLAIVLFAFLFVSGRPVPGTTIGALVKGYPAESGGLMKNDKILEIAGQPIKTFQDLTRGLDATQPGPVKITFERAGEVLDLNIVLKDESIKDVFGKDIRAKRLGVVPSSAAAVFERFGPRQALVRSLATVYDIASSTYKALFYVILGKMSLKAMSGPIGIISKTGDAAKLGLPYVLQLMAVLSVSLAVINFFPVPALDGGHVMFLLVELVRRKRVSLEFQDKASQIGFTLLLVLMAFVIYNDMINLEVVNKVKSLFGF